MFFQQGRPKLSDLLRFWKRKSIAATTVHQPSASQAMSPEALGSKLILLRTHYTSKPVDVPSSFLQTPPEKPVTFEHISFADSQLPEYAGSFAVLLENVLAPSECAQLLQLAEASVPEVAEGASPWRLALVNMGNGHEAARPDVRNSGRIIWDSQTVVDRVWQRCLLARGEGEPLAAMLSRTPEDEEQSGGTWKFERLNERMRFLKYTKGQYFKAHRDGKYEFTADDSRFQTHYTVHLYLSDSAKTSADGSGCVGGATAFLSHDHKRRLDVDPKAGSVLIFQHRGLLHQGAEVHSGTKYTMRTDIVYRWMPE